MREIIPVYYPLFKCIAGDCRNSCCIGWEICVDADSLSRYRNISDAFGRRLAEGISDGCFKTDENGRCCFLNEHGLCDIILSLGESALCQICADHPRFRNFFDSRVELGLGLCCEEAARIILGYSEKVTLIGEEDAAELSEYEKSFFSFRRKLFEILQDRSTDISERAKAALKMCGAVIPEKTQSEWADIYISLERLNPEWTDMLESLRNSPPRDMTIPEELQIPYEQLLIYFTYRHVSAAFEEGGISTRMAFAVQSMRIINAVCLCTGEHTLERLTDAARIYSGEIEYSEENTEALLDILDI